MNKKTFCIFPWIHLHPNPDDSVTTCCENAVSVGNLSKNSLDEIAINSQMNDIRKKMINDEELPECRSCYNKEKSKLKSVRVNANLAYQDIISDCINNTNEDGSLKTQWKMRHFNLRLSNLCNMACRSCYGMKSSLIATEEGKKQFIIKISDFRPTLMSEIIKHLPWAESVTFAGGETILIDEYWEIMDKLIEINNVDLELFYYTNLSKIVYRDKSFIDYLSKFKNHKLLLSIDGFGDRLELYRHNSNWNAIHANLKKVCESKLNFVINSTIGAINIWHLPDFERLLIEEGILNFGVIEHNTLVNPKHLSVQILPKHYKDMVSEKIINHQNYLRLNNLDYLCSSWDNVLNFLYASDNTELLASFFSYNQHLDEKRNQNLYEVFPELITVKDYYDQVVLNQ